MTERAPFLTDLTLLLLAVLFLFLSYRLALLRKRLTTLQDAHDTLVRETREAFAAWADSR
jgi:hypothetical protein